MRADIIEKNTFNVNLVSLEDYKQVDLTYELNVASVRLIFRGGSMKVVDKETCIIDFKASQQLGIECEGSTAHIKSEPQWIARIYSIGTIL